MKRAKMIALLDELVDKDFYRNWRGHFYWLNSEFRRLDPSEYDDVIQDALCRAIERCNKYDKSKKSFKAWFKAVMHSSYRDRVTWNIKGGLVYSPVNRYDFYTPQEDAQEEIDNQREGGNEIDIQIIAATQILRTYIGSHNELSKKVLELYYLEGESKLYISKYLDRPYSTVSSIVDRFCDSAVSMYEES